MKQICLHYTLNVTRYITRSIKDLETDILGIKSLADPTGNRGHKNLGGAGRVQVSKRG